MSHSRIYILVTSELSHDPRVTKEAQTAFEHGYDVCVICREHLGDTPPYKVATFGTKRPESLLGKYVERTLSMILMFYLVIRGKPDIIHANDLDTLPVGFWAGKLLRSKIIYDSHELWPDASSRLHGAAGSIADGLQRFLLHRIDGVVTVNEYIAGVLKQRYGFSAPILVVKNTPYLEYHEMLSPRNWVKKFAGKKIVLYLSRFIPNRGIEDAIDAAMYLSDDIVVVFRGYGPLENKMKQWVMERRLGKKVFFLPPVPMEDIVAASVGADVGLVLYDPVNASNYHVSPNKLFELMMAGVPMIGSDVPFLRMLLLKYGLGDVYTPGNAKELAEKIMLIAHNESLHATMKENCLKYRQQFCWEKEGEKLIRFYETIAS